MNRRLSDHALSLLRFYIGGNAIVAWYNAVNDSRSLIAQTTNNSDATVFIWLMPVFGLCVVIDVLINDVMPKRFTWQRALSHRHLLLIGLGVCYFAQPFVSSMLHNESPLRLYYAWNTSIICLASFLDAKKRSREAQCGIYCN